MEEVQTRDGARLDVWAQELREVQELKLELRALVEQQALVREAMDRLQLLHLKRVV